MSIDITIRAFFYDISPLKNISYFRKAVRKLTGKNNLGVSFHPDHGVEWDTFLKHISAYQNLDITGHYSVCCKVDDLSCPTHTS